MWWGTLGRLPVLGTLEGPGSSPAVLSRREWSLKPWKTGAWLGLPVLFPLKTNRQRQQTPAEGT